MKQSSKNKQPAPKGKVIQQNRIVFWISLLVGVCSFGILVISYIPATRVNKVINISEKGILDAGLNGFSKENPPSVSIDYPSRVYAGDAAEVHIRFNPSGVKLADQSHLIADFLLELDGSNVGPDGDILIPIMSPYPAEAKWNLAPFRSGDLVGTAWLHLQTTEGEGQIKRFLIIAYPLDIQSDIFIGGSIMFVRIICFFLFFTTLIILLIIAVRNWPVETVVKEK